MSYTFYGFIFFKIPNTIIHCIFYSYCSSTRRMQDFLTVPYNQGNLGIG